MNRLELLNECKDMTNHNIHCYSTDILMTEPKPEYKEQWHLENEKLELINELIEEETSNDFRLNTTIYNIQNNREDRVNKDLALLLDRKRGLSCYLSLERSFEDTLEYYLTFSIHNKEKFDEEYENIYSTKIDINALKSRQSLKLEMKEGLNKFQKYVEADSKLKNYFKLLSE